MRWRPDSKKIAGIYRRYWSAKLGDGELPANEVPSLARLQRQLDEIRGALERIAAAADDPLAAGAAEILAAADELEPYSDNGIVADTLLDLAQLGEAIAFGDDPAELAELAASVREENRRGREEWQALFDTEEARDEHAWLVVQNRIEALVNAADGDCALPSRALTLDERWRLVRELEERLGLAEQAGVDAH